MILKKSSRSVQKNKVVQFIESLIIIVPIAFLIRTFFYGLYQVPSGSMETTMLVGERFFADKFTILFSKPKHGDVISFNDPTYSYSDNKLINLWQQYVWGPANYTKRVIAVPGDEIKGVIEDGKPIVYLKKKGEEEFKKLDELYLNKYPLIATPGRRGEGIDYRSFDPNYSPEDQPYYRVTKAEILLGEKLAKAYGLPAIKYPGMVTMDRSKNYDEFEQKLGQDEYWVMGDNRLNSSDSRMWGPLKENLIHGKIVFRIWSLDSDESWWIFDLLRHPIDFWKRVRWSRCLQTIH